MASPGNGLDESFRKPNEPLMLADMSSSVTFETCKSMQRGILTQFSLEINKTNGKVDSIQESLFGVTVGGTIKEPGLIKSVNELLLLQRKKSSTTRWIVERIVLPISMAVIIAGVLGYLPI